MVFGPAGAVFVAASGVGGSAGAFAGPGACTVGAGWAAGWASSVFGAEEHPMSVNDIKTMVTETRFRIGFPFCWARAVKLPVCVLEFNRAESLFQEMRTVVSRSFEEPMAVDGRVSATHRPASGYQVEIDEMFKTSSTRRWQEVTPGRDATDP